MIAIGRIPNWKISVWMNLESIMIKGIIVNKDFQTNLPNIYAIGDVTGKMMLAHSATYSGYHVLRHILEEESNIDFQFFLPVFFVSGGCYRWLK